MTHPFVLPSTDDEVKLVSAQADGFDVGVPDKDVCVGEYQGALGVLCVYGCGSDAEDALVRLIPRMLCDHIAAKRVRRF